MKISLRSVRLCVTQFRQEQPPSLPFTNTNVVREKSRVLRRMLEVETQVHNISWIYYLFIFVPNLFTPAHIYTVCTVYDSYISDDTEKYNFLVCVRRQLVCYFNCELRKILLQLRETNQTICECIA